MTVAVHDSTKYKAMTTGQRQILHKEEEKRTNTVHCKGFSASTCIKSNTTWSVAVLYGGPPDKDKIFFIPLAQWQSGYQARFPHKRSQILIPDCSERPFCVEIRIYTLNSFTFVFVVCINNLHLKLLHPLLKYCIIYII